MTTDNILAPVAALTLPDQSPAHRRRSACSRVHRRICHREQRRLHASRPTNQDHQGQAKDPRDQRTAITGPLNAADQGGQRSVPRTG